MAEITCPNCGTVISLEQSEIESVAKQVRDEEFHRELDERIRLIEAEKAQALKLVESVSAEAGHGLARSGGRSSRAGFRLHVRAAVGLRRLRHVPVAD